MDETTSDLQLLNGFIKDIGFDSCGEFRADLLVARPEVRQMCAADKCQSYGTSWSCPPACGSIEEFQQLYSRYKKGLLFQTVVQLEDSFDFEAIIAGSELHKERFSELIKMVNDSGRDIALLGAGSCGICSQCSYPNEPCKQPDMMRYSMEATGLLVSDVCVAAGIPYNHGEGTLAYSSCALLA